MAKLHFIAPEIAKRKKIKLRWKLACLVLSLVIIAENAYLLYIMR